MLALLMAIGLGWSAIAISLGGGILWGRGHRLIGGTLFLVGVTMPFGLVVVIVVSLHATESAPASIGFCASTRCYHGTEDVPVLPVVVTEFT